MIPEVGVFCLSLAFSLSFLQAFSAFIFPRTLLNTVTSAAAWLHSLCCLLAFALLIYTYISSDFSVVNVVENSHTFKPLLYKITGVWGNHEGSMLLWALILAIYTTAACQWMNKEFLPQALVVLGAVSAGIYLYLLLASNPFARIFPPPAQGYDLNPLLQDIGLAIHPPLLYLGYVGFAVPFALGVSGIMGNNISRAWASAMRPWVLIAWSSLTAGIGLGAWWAYRELGWGGWWFWDPVENAALVPWLTGTALLHSLIVLEKRGQLGNWCALLAILTFTFCLIGTFLVRSGVLVSVHSFATDPTRGLFILAYIAIVSGGALIIYARHAMRSLTTMAAPLPLFSRSGFILLNNLLMVAASLTVLTGILYPLLSEALWKENMSVGHPYYSITVVPMLAAAAFLAAPAPALQWLQGKWPLKLSLIALLFSILGGFLMWNNYEPHTSSALLGSFIGFWLIAHTLAILIRRAGGFSKGVFSFISSLLALPVRLHAMALAHIGAGLLVLGSTGSHLWKQEIDQRFEPGTVQVHGNYRFEQLGSSRHRSNNYDAETLRILLQENKSPTQEMLPELRNFPTRGMETSEAAIHTNIKRDIYMVPHRSFDGTQLQVRYHIIPLMSWVWAGITLMAAGGIMAALLKPRRS